MKQKKLSHVEKLSEEDKINYYKIEQMELDIQENLSQIYRRLIDNAEKIQRGLKNVEEPDNTRTLSDLVDEIAHDLMWMVPNMGIERMVRDASELRTYMSQSRNTNSTKRDKI